MVYARYITQNLQMSYFQLLITSRKTKPLKQVKNPSFFILYPKVVMMHTKQSSINAGTVYWAQFSGLVRDD